MKHVAKSEDLVRVSSDGAWTATVKAFLPAVGSRLLWIKNNATSSSAPPHPLKVEEPGGHRQSQGPECRGKVKLANQRVQPTLRMR